MQDGWTPLHLAACNGHQEVVHELIVGKCNVNMRTESGMGPLHMAASQGFEEIVQQLLDAGAAPDMQDKVRWENVWLDQDLLLCSHEQKSWPRLQRNQGHAFFSLSLSLFHGIFFLRLATLHSTWL